MSISPANEPVRASYVAGTHDENGHLLAGTEFINLAVFDQKLFGGIGAWMDPANGRLNPGKEAPGPQIVVLDSAKGKWRQDFAFSELQNGRRRFLRVTALQALTFTNTRDDKGRVVPLAKPKSVLLAGLDGQTAARGAIFIRVGETKAKDGAVQGNWIETPLQKGDYKLQSFRAFALYRDPESGLDRIYVGVGAQKDDMPGAIFSGYYDENMPGPVKIHWDTKPEFSGFEHRVMSFGVSDNKLFFAAKPSIYERVSGGDNPKWRECYRYPLEKHAPVNASIHSSGMRGLTGIDDPSHPQHSVILTGYEGVPGDMLRLDPITGQVQEELETFPFLRRLWNKQQQKSGAKTPNVQAKPYVILGYNEMMKIDSPSGAVRLVPLLAHSTNSDETNSAWFLTRKEGALDANGYSLHEVKPIAQSRNNSTDPGLWAVRTMMVSPFPEDKGEVLYLGGYDAHHTDSKNTAWLYRAGINTILKPYGQP